MKDEKQEAKDPDAYHKGVHPWRDCRRAGGEAARLRRRGRTADTLRNMYARYKFKGTCK